MDKKNIKPAKVAEKSSAPQKPARKKRRIVLWLLLFLFLLGVIVLFADMNSQRLSLFALAIATLSFFWRLFPIIRKMDKDGQIVPPNYSVVLGIMIFAFIVVFVVAAML